MVIISVRYEHMAHRKFLKSEVSDMAFPHSGGRFLLLNYCHLWYFWATFVIPSQIPTSQHLTEAQSKHYTPERLHYFGTVKSKVSHKSFLDRGKFYPQLECMKYNFPQAMVVLPWYYLITLYQCSYTWPTIVTSCGTCDENTLGSIRESNSSPR